MCVCAHACMCVCDKDLSVSVVILVLNEASVSSVLFLDPTRKWRLPWDFLSRALVFLSIETMSEVAWFMFCSRAILMVFKPE